MSLEKNYAAAFLETAKEAGFSSRQLNQAEQQLKELKEALDSSKQLQSSLTGPKLNFEEKSRIIEDISEIQNWSPAFKRFVLLLIKKQRLSSVGGIYSAFKRVRLEAEDCVLGNLYSAEALTAEEVLSFEELFTKKTGKKVVLQPQIIPDLIAGISVDLSGKTYDGSLRFQLRKLKEKVLMEKGHDVVT